MRSNQWAGVTPEERFWPKVRQAEEGCWVWTAAHDTHGYGLLWLNRRWIGAHRFAYELVIGPIPAGLELDHICRNKGCVNPAHLEPVTHLENTRRGVPYRGWTGSHNAGKTHCPQGHPYTSENTKRYRGGRSCRACAILANRQYRVRRRGFLVSSVDELDKGWT